MNRNELIAAVNRLKIPLSEVAKEVSIPVGALNKFWHNKKELQELEFDRLVKWVIEKNNEPERKAEIMAERNTLNEIREDVYKNSLTPEEEFEKGMKEILDKRPQETLPHTLSNLVTYGQSVTHEPTGAVGVTLEECERNVEELSSVIEFASYDDKSFDGEKIDALIQDEYPNLHFASPKPWIKKIEDFCYENKITPEELIQGYVAPRVKPVPRSA